MKKIMFIVFMVTTATGVYGSKQQLKRGCEQHKKENECVDMLTLALRDTLRLKLSNDLHIEGNLRFEEESLKKENQDTYISLDEMCSYIKKNEKKISERISKWSEAAQGENKILEMTTNNLVESIEKVHMPENPKASLSNSHDKCQVCDLIEDVELLTNAIAKQSEANNLYNKYNTFNYKMYKMFGIRKECRERIVGILTLVPVFMVANKLPVNVVQVLEVPFAFAYPIIVNKLLKAYLP